MPGRPSKNSYQQLSKTLQKERNQGQQWTIRVVSGASHRCWWKIDSLTESAQSDWVPYLHMANALTSPSPVPCIDARHSLQWLCYQTPITNKHTYKVMKCCMTTRQRKRKKDIVSTWILHVRIIWITFLTDPYVLDCFWLDYRRKKSNILVEPIWL